MMNENIKKLADEAELTAGVWTVPDFIIERFAVSLIEQCVKICGNVRYTGYCPPEDGAAPQYYNDAAENCADDIKDYFGVNHG